MSHNKTILLTFDYEPFLGAKSGSAEKCILQPTNALRLILNKYNAKAIFFVDVFYLFNLKRHSELKEDYTKVINQIKNLFQEGHYIFPHIHPHWLDAVYIKEKKEFSLTNLSRYSLASLSLEQIKTCFRDAIFFLEEIGVSYTNWGYRAGGWCIQPFDLFKEIFILEKINYDFSVLPGYKNDNPTQAFDYTEIDTYRPYQFNSNVTKKEEGGVFTELPISTIAFSKLDLFKDRLVRKYLWKLNDRGWGDGISAQTAALKSVNINSEMISIDVLTVAKLPQYKRFLVTNDYMHWISHPKMFTKHGLKSFDKFMKYATGNFNVIFDFKSK